jgi:very-short-patch-repair endonuclease
LLVSYSLTLATNIAEIDRIPVTTVERTIIDLWPSLAPPERLRMLREALRLRRTTTTRMLAALHAHRGRRGVESLRTEVLALGGLRLERCLSDAEAFAVALLHERGVDAPEVNQPIAGRRADLSWPARRLIVEIDGPSFHVLRDADIAMMRRWEAAGFTVRRIPSDVLYADPCALLRLAPPARSNVPPSRL